MFYILTENEMDGDSLVTLIGSKPGPDSLKDLVQKVGVLMKLCKAIWAFYSEETVNIFLICFKTVARF